MACHRRALTTGFIHISRRLHPSFSHIPLSHGDRSDPPPPLPKPSSSGHGHGHGHGIKAPPFTSTSLGFSFPLGADSFLRRNYSSSGSSADGSTEIGYIKDVAEVLTETTVDATAATAATATAVADAAAAGVPPFSAEVVAAAADSYFPVAALQYLIDGVHTNVGVDWWAAIVLTTVLIRCSTVPLILNQMRSTVKLNAMRPEMEQIKEQMQNSTDPESLLEGRKQMSALFRKHGVTPLTPLKGMFIQGPIFISFFMAISNMVEKVPSFKDGGAYWFTDLTTPDPLYALPILTGLSFLATVELNMQDGMEGNPMVNTMKNFSRILAFVTVPFTASFPKAIFCYWITSNIFSLAYGFIIRRPPVRKFLNLPEIVPQPTTASQPNFSFLGGSKLLSSLASPIAAKLSEPSKSPDQKVSSSAVISQRIRNLEKTVKARSRPKRR